MSIDAMTDVELKSEDGVAIKVKAYHLLSASDFFRDMFTLPNINASPSPNDQSGAKDPITMDVPAHSIILGLFAQLVSLEPLKPLQELKDRPSLHQASAAGSGSPASDRGQKVWAFIALLSLMDSLLCASPLHTLVFRHFKPAYHEDPWAVFSLAAHRGDLKAAKKAIQLFYHLTVKPDGRTSQRVQTCKVDPAVMALKDVERVPISWFLGYSRVYSVTPKSHPAASTLGAYNITSQASRSMQEVEDKVFWDKVAQGFNPVLE